MTTPLVSNKQLEPGQSDQKYYFFDDFLGSSYDDTFWYPDMSVGTTTAIVAGATNGQIRFRSDTDDSIYFNWGYYQTIPKRNWEITICLSRPNTANYIELGVKSESDGFIAFGCWTTDALTTYTNDGTSESQGTSNYADGVFRLYKIVVGSTDVKFYIDGVLINTHTTHIPDEMFEPYVFSVSYDDAVDIFIDYVEVVATRE